jgi:hypothetical protein
MHDETPYWITATSKLPASFSLDSVQFSIENCWLKIAIVLPFLASNNFR